MDILMVEVAGFFAFRHRLQSIGRLSNHERLQMIGSRLQRGQELWLGGHVKAGDLPGEGSVRSQRGGKVYAVSLEGGGQCDCGDLSTLLCKHLHALAMELGGLEAFGLTVNSERFPSSKSMKANHDAVLDEERFEHGRVQIPISLDVTYMQTEINFRLRPGEETLEQGRILYQ